MLRVSTISLKGGDIGALKGIFNIGGSTGTHSVYTQWNGMEIMFHVSTLLPYTPGDHQQVRKLLNDRKPVSFQCQLTSDSIPID